MFATSDERKGNRGGLSLKKHFADFIITVDDTITGQHDLAHTCNFHIQMFSMRKKDVGNKSKMLSKQYQERDL